MKVCGKKDIHVPGCSDCEELEERVEAVEECCEDAQTKIEDKADTTYVDENIGTIEGQITEVSDALNERIDNIITSSEPSITTLWEGALSFKGDSAQLSDDVSNYDFLDVYYKTSTAIDSGYYGYIRVPSDEYENYTTTIGGINRRATGAGIRQYLTMLSFVDDTATIQDIRRWYWDGSAASDAEDSSYQSGIGIYRIDGVKISGVDAEIADARVGVDGTVYPSLGDAIRGQIQDTRDMIPQLVKTVQGNPIVLDDAFGEVKNLTVELLPIQEGSGTPSPQNVRPIAGHDSVTVTDTDGDSQSQSKTVTLPHTVYGAGVGVTSGESKDKMEFIETDSTTNYTVTSPARQEIVKGWAVSVISPTVRRVLKNNGTCYSSINEPKRYYETSVTGFCKGLGYASFVFFIKDTDSGLDGTATSAQVSDAVVNYLHTHQMQAVYELATPTDLSTTPTPLTLYSGDNVISSDGQIDLSYVQDMAAVIRKIENQL